MPIVAIGIAVAADAFAITAPTIFAVIGAVGATVAAVGVVTKDKTLTTIGAVLGGVGGIGALATSVGVIGDLSTAANTASETAAGATAATTEQIASEIPGTAADLAAPTAEGAVNELTSLNVGPENVAALGDTADTAAAAAPDAAPSAAADTGSAPTSLPTFGTGITMPNISQNIGLQGQNLGGNPSFPIQNALNTTPVTTPPGGIMSFLQSAGGGQLAGMGLMAGASFLSSATNPLTPAQIASFQAQAAANNADAALKNQQVSNIASGMPTAVTGAPAVTKVSGAPAPANTVSGAPMITPVSGKPIGLINQPAVAA